MRKLAVLLSFLVIALAWLVGDGTLRLPDPFPGTPAPKTGVPERRAPAVSPTPRTEPRRSADARALPAFLPPEARQVVERIRAGGPFDHAEDGSVFANREKRLPPRPRGYYHEYTVRTPGVAHRGARRIVTGGEPPEIWYWTADHYRSFRPFEVAP